ncbi:NAD-dependent epimerase/dehydratase family protein [Mucilaginibacter lappiensis]|uniref:Nucleoside-diphosphate-sugar epimerase n=1 Tax=Mucilaginibacter lappiensis TaxID=354630 RepID=A0A841JCV2_9SPHI|nr:NAD-dependent epimerase/dehydratase family protein [Mucilaginibacter lappiensis]MBB6128172.1 nucleoside-diphosphate-sugar epimerase [Mucilaginibacter lappiensis]
MTNNAIIKEDLHTIYNSAIDWSRFSGKTVLITGANGFLPAYMIETLLFASKHFSDYQINVIGLVRNIIKAKKRFADYLDNPNLKFIEQDVSEEINIDTKIDFIIHAASQASPKYYGTDPVGTLSANVLGTNNLLNLARKHQIESFLFFSSSEIYGLLNNDTMTVDEDYYGYLNPLLVRSCYAESKRMGENMCASYLHQYQVNSKIIRPFHTYGPGMDLNDGRVFVDFVSNVLKGEDIIIKSDGTAKRAYCYITDAITAYFKVLLDGKNGEAYNVGNPDNEFSVRELADLLVSLADDKSVKVIMENGDQKNYLPSQVSRIIPDIKKLKAFDWTPRVSAKEGFYRTITSYKKEQVS